MRSWSDLKRDGRFYLSRLLNRSLTPPDWLSINLTLRCNLKCSMCTTCYDAPELSQAQVLDLIDQAAAWGVRVFNPLGGEPFIRQDLEAILLHAASRDMHTTLTSNGTLIHARRAEGIARVPPEKLHINLSIDGLQASHDRIRGAGMFQRTLSGYRHLRTADANAGNPQRKICVNTILHRENLEEFEELLEFLETEGVSGVQILNLFRHGTEATADHLWFDAPQWPALTQLCERLAQKNSRFILNRPEDLRLIPRYYQEGLRPLEAPCWAGWKELYINADGTAIMCDGKLDFLKGSFGSIHQQTLREIWQSPELSARRQVVKTCETPCIQNCYLRRESDSSAALIKDSLRLSSAPVLQQLRRLGPRQLLDRDLVLELCDIPDTPGPRLQALLLGAPLPDPETYLLWRDHRRLETGRGFMGAGVMADILSAFADLGIVIPCLDLRWRGEPLLHPEFLAVLQVLRAAHAKGNVQKIRLRSSGRMLGPSLLAALRGGPWEFWVQEAEFLANGALLAARLDRPVPERAWIISWDGKLTTHMSDTMLQQKQGDVLHESLGEILKRASLKF